MFSNFSPGTSTNFHEIFAPIIDQGEYLTPMASAIFPVTHRNAQALEIIDVAWLQWLVTIEFKPVEVYASGTWAFLLEC